MNGVGAGYGTSEQLGMQPTKPDSRTTPIQIDRVPSAWVFPAMGTGNLGGGGS